MNTKTNELIKFNEKNSPSPETFSTMTPKDVERVIKEHYNWNTNIDEEKIKKLNS